MAYKRTEFGLVRFRFPAKDLEYAELLLVGVVVAAAPPVKESPSEVLLTLCCQLDEEEGVSDAVGDEIPCFDSACRRRSFCIVLDQFVSLKERSFIEEGTNGSDPGLVRSYPWSGRLVRTISRTKSQEPRQR